MVYSNWKLFLIIRCKNRRRENRTAKMDKRLNGRVWLLDEIRGVAILLMVLYHTGYDLVAIFGLDFPFFFSRGLNFVRDLMAGTFILLAGCACRFSRNNLQRGLSVFLFGMAMTAVTLLIIPEQRILFGILHLLGLSMILFPFLRRALDKLPPLWGFLLFTALFLLLFRVPAGQVLGLPLPSAPYELRFLFPLGFPAPAFYSSDYFPIVPWMFLFFAGSYAGIPIKAGRFPSFFYRQHSEPLCFIGRHTLWIYVLHQPIIYGLLSLIFNVLLA